MGEPSHDTAVTATPTTEANLSNLPEDVLLRVLSFLPTLDAITTSLISQKFRSLWSINPSLYFSYSLFPPYKNSSTTLEFYAQFINHTLINRSHTTPLLKFRLEFSFFDRYTAHLDSWIRYAIKYQAQELILDFTVNAFNGSGRSQTQHLYDFPFHVLRNGNVRILKLIMCDLTLPVNMSSMRLVLMKSMFLGYVYLTDQMVLDLLCGCPNLEVFELEYVFGLENLRVFSEKLKELELRYILQAENGVNLEIDSPNLVSLGIVSFEIGEFCIKDLSSLVRFRTCIEHRMDDYRYWKRVVRLLDQVPHIRSLTVQNWWLKFAPKDVFPRGFLLHNLKHLELQTRYTQSDLLGMAALVELCPNLETMILDYVVNTKDDSLSEELVNKPIYLSLPSLREVKMKGVRGTEDESNFVALLKEQGVVLQKIVMVPVQADEALCPPIILCRRHDKNRDLEGSAQTKLRSEE